MGFEIMHGDCVEVMRGMPEGHVDAIVCDPPYGLEFMGKEWDRLQVSDKGDESNRQQEWHYQWAIEALRVLKPGGHLLAFGGTRTYHRMAVAIEDAGFEIRDTIAWLYGSGFPKSLNVSKAIDKAAGAEREVIGTYTCSSGTGEAFGKSVGDSGGSTEVNRTAPATPDAQKWDGWGTALKPAHEPIVVARKPFRGTVAANVLAHGTGALNIDGCRITTHGESFAVPQSDPTKRDGTVGTDLGITGSDVDRFQQAQRESIERTVSMGRWPANVILTHHEDCVEVGTKTVHTGPGVRPIKGKSSSEGGGNTGPAYGAESRPEGTEMRFYRDSGGNEVVPAFECHPECPVRILDEQSGVGKSGARKSGKYSTRAEDGVYMPWDKQDLPALAASTGGASRFFYCAKASRSEREAGLEGLDGSNEQPAPMGQASKVRECRVCNSRSKSADPSLPYPTCGHDDWHLAEQKKKKLVRNSHPTVKPIALMAYLIRLVTPPGGTVLDPFMGSGTTLIAAVREGFVGIGIEQDESYIEEIARPRILHHLSLTQGG